MNRIFVYGTLMKGERAHGIISGSRFLGNYRLAEYAMYDLGSYPGIKETIGESVVGEVYEITQEMITALDRYEGEGSLYKRVIEKVSRENHEIEVYVYVYLPEVKGSLQIERWNAKNNDYIWYACYGSNICAERFNNYIEGGFYKPTGSYCSGCKDKSRWIDECNRQYKGRLYFAKNSGRWNGKGVAFYDPQSESRRTYMKLYKITREQFHDVQIHEGPAWYGRVVCFDVHSDNCPVYTMTSNQIFESNNPSDKYLTLIRRALIDELNIDVDEADSYLRKAVED